VPALYPAIDVLGGKAVRLERGDFEASSDYDDDPLDAAGRWCDQGARRLHVVDLDGAKRGEPVNLQHLSRIATALGSELEQLQYGGGLRSSAAVRDALSAGATRVVLGTAAFRDRELLRALIADCGDSVAVGVDVRGGKVAVAGWTERTEIEAGEAIQSLLEVGVETIVFTDTDRDGMLTGADVETARMASTAIGERRFVYSGGIGSLADLESLARLGLPNLDGVIVGKALYEERFTIVEAQEALAARAAG
jgi:phosphoribosylformimino-5-aminoimidazole carboxamide ribotide isomerase